MKKLSIVLSIFFLALLPVVNTQASSPNYYDNDWTTRTGPFPEYIETEILDITGWDSLIIYIDPASSPFTEFTVGSGVSRLAFFNNGTYVTQIPLSDIYTGSISGEAWTRVPDGVNQVRIEIYKNTTYDTGYLNLYNTVWDDSLTQSVGAATGGYTTGYNDGYNQARTELLSDAAISYSEGYTQGQLDSENSTLAIATFIPQVLALGFGFFFQVFSVEVMGISVLQWFAALMTVSMGIIIFRTLLK